MIKKILKSNSYLYPKMRLWNRITMKILFVNFIFQRILRIHSKIPISINFTSRIDENNIVYHKDDNTLSSFAVSGHCYFQAFNGIVLGKNCLFGPGVKIISANHALKDTQISIEANPVKIGDNVWIGANAIILPEVEIGNNCVVGAGSVVTKCFFDDNLIIAGNPAKIIGHVKK